MHGSPVPDQHGAQRPLPRVEQRGHVTQLLVDDAPYLVLGGELHNSSSSSPAYMGPIWQHLADAGLRTVITPVTWQLLEPEEGRFDFTTLDDQITQARRHGMRLIVLWFGSYKNAESTYTPTWVRRDETRFPRARRDPRRRLPGRFPLDAPILSPFSEELMSADARAFAALMRHLREIDGERTVIAVQVENEVGLLGDSRDRSSAAEAAWSAPVPDELLVGLANRGESLRDHVRELWSEHGSRSSGRWDEVFGPTADAEEIFMSWAFARFLEHVAAAGATEYPLPLFANAWLGPQPNAASPGQYPSGGPVARMQDVWKVTAPSLAFLSPDIYVQDFSGTLADFRAADNPLLIPEARPEAALAFVAVGGFAAMGFSPFAIEDLPVDHEVFRAYRALEPIVPMLIEAQAENRVHGFRIRTGEEQTTELGGFRITIRGPIDTRGMFGLGTGQAADDVTGYGLLIQTGEDDFLALILGASVVFARQDAEVEIDSVEEGSFRDGIWEGGRVLNGDERHFMFPNDQLRMVRISLLRRAPLVTSR